ncbi:hypothetical protein HZH66_004518 [Vespula vulgaris]|uniref:Uncharacterized protein n=1 Tax=Vespula vulgaris TaxID=7454 RepID=A0A834KAL4_VESVU|nr:hypothetical protein HZH66_004518 [Vespula vulgaris]
MVLRQCCMLCSSFLVIVDSIEFCTSTIFCFTTNLAQIVASEFKKNVRHELCRRILRNNDFHDSIPRKKVLIRKTNQINCHVWVSANGIRNLVFIDSILDKYKYSYIPKHNFKKSTTKLGLLENFYFQQDNDSKYTIKIVKE